jgi:hypothetical protein
MSAIYVVSMAISHDDDRSCSLIDHDNHLHSIGPLSGFQDAMQVVIAEKLPMRLRINPDNMSSVHVRHSSGYRHPAVRLAIFPMAAVMCATLEVDRCGWYWGGVVALARPSRTSKLYRRSARIE